VGLDYTPGQKLPMSNSFQQAAYFHFKSQTPSSTRRNMQTCICPFRLLREEFALPHSRLLSDSGMPSHFRLRSHYRQFECAV
jgi:hypothetical protein